MAAPVFSSVTYLSPWLPLPPGQSVLGLDAIVNSGAPAGQVLAGRLRQGANQLAVAVAISPTEVTMLPPYPLSSMLDYAVDVQWVAAGTPPEKVTWTDPTAIATAPVLTAFARGVYGLVNGKQVQLMWEFGAAAVMPAGATVTGFNSKTKSVGFLVQAGVSGTLNLSGAPDVGTRLYFQAMMPISGDPNAGFKPPFTFGPIQSGVPLPMAAPALTAVQCDGTSAQVAWTAPPVPDPAPLDIRHELGLLDAQGNVLGWYPAGPGGGIAQLPSPPSGALQVAARTRYGAFIGAPGPATAILEAPATITAIAVSQDAQSAKVSFANATLPAGAGFVAELSGPGGTVTAPASGSPPQANLSITPVPGGGYTVSGFTQSSQGGITLTGPAGAAFAVPTMPVTGLAGTFAGDVPAVSWQPSGEPGVTRYQVVAAVDGATGTYVTEANEFVIPLRASAGAAINVTVAPMGDLALGPGAALQLTAPLPAAPTITATGFDGTAARVDWAALTAGPLDGYGATFSGIDSGDKTLAFKVPLGVQTSMATALPLDGRAHAWSVEILALAGGQAAPSSPAWIPTVAPVLGPCSVATVTQGLTVSIGWALDCTAQQLQAMVKAGAQLEFALLDGDNSVIVTQQPFTDASGTAQLTVAEIGSAQQYVTARLVGPPLDAGPAPQFATGPRAAPVPLLAVAPAVTGAAYDGSNLSVAWSGGLAGATGWKVTLTQTDGQGVQTFETGPEPQLDIPAVISGGAWNVTVQALGPNSTGLTSAAFPLATPKLNPPTIETLDWDGNMLSVGWTPSAALADYQLLVTSDNQGLFAGLVVGVESTVRFPLAIPGDAANPKATVAARRVNWTDVNAQASAAIVTAVPAVSAIAVDPASGKATASWAAVLGATAYRVRLTEDGAEAGVIQEVTATSADFVPPPGGAVAVSVAAIVASAPLRATGPFGPPAALPAQAPAVIATAYDGANITLAWEPVAGATGYRASVYQHAATQPIAAPVLLPAGAAASFACAFPAPDQTYVLVLQALFGPFDGPPSAPAPLLAAPTGLAHPAFDGRTISVPVATPQGPAPAGYAMTVLRDGAAIQAASVPAAATLELAVTPPADPAASYSVSVRPQLGIALGPAASMAFAVTAPPLAATNWNGDQVDATVTLSAGWSAQGRLLIDGVPQTPVPFDGGGKASLPAPANGAVAISVQGTAGGAMGPWSAPLPLSRAVPAGIALALDGTTLTASWTPVSGADSYALTLKSDGHPDTSVTVGQPNATLTIPDADAATQLLVSAVQGIATGPASTPVAAIIATVPISTIDYQDGVLSLAWGQVTGATGYRVVVTTGETTTATADFAQAQGSLAVPPGPYGLAVRAFDAVALGPSAATVAPATVAPELTSAAFAANGDLTISWPVVGGATDYVVRLVAPDQGYVDTPAHGTGPTISCTIPAAQVPDRQYTALCRVASQGQTPAVTGSWSVPLDLPAAVPAGLELQLDGELLTAVWESVEGADGYAATVTADQGPALTQLVYEPQMATVLADGTTAASVTVAAIFGPVTGRASAPAVALFGAPALSQAAYQDGQLSLAWSAVAAASAYRVSLMTGETAAVEAEFAGTSGTIPAPAGAYEIVLAALSSDAAGPASASVAALTAAPAIVSAAFDPASGDCTVSWPAVGAAAYGIRLSQPGQPPFDDAFAAGGDPVSYVIPSAKLAGGPFTFVCRGLDAVASPVASGPWSAALALPLAMPRGLLLQLDGQQLAASWDPVAGVGGYAVHLTIDSGTLAEETFQPAAAFNLPAGTTTASLKVAAMFGNVTGMASPAATAIFAAPTLASASYDGATLTLAWTAAAGSSGTRVSLLVGGTVLAEADFTGTQGTIPITPGAWQVELRALAAGAVGPATAPATPISAAPAIASAVFDPLTGNCTVNWPAVSGADGYATALYQPGQPAVSDSFKQTGTTISYVIPSAKLAGGGPFSFAVQATADGPPALAGPGSAATALPSLAPAALSAGYDGAVVRGAWMPIGGAEGYRLSLVSGGAVTPLGDVAGTDAVLTPASAPAADAALTVQALGSLGPGPAATGVPLFARGWFLNAQSPWGAAPLTAPAAAATDLVLALPDLFGGNQPAGPLPDNATFKMVADGPGYSLTIPASAPAWLWDATSRAAVRTDYGDFTAKLETAGWTPQMRALVLDAVARSLPQTFDEALYYAYGFEPAQGWFDLRPGMVLRVEYESYQYLGPASSLPDPDQAKYLDGFVAAAVADYPVSGSGSGATWFVTLDSALAQMAANEGIQVPAMPPQPTFAEGGGGLVDAFFDQFRKPLCRLVYPPNVIGQGSVGDARPTNNPMLLAASTLADLQNAATAVRNAAPLPSNVGSFYFRGRATLTPRIRVLLDGTPLLVPLGTSVGDVLAERGGRGFATGAGLRVQRATGAAAIQPDQPAWLDVRLDWSGAQPAWLGLPLLAGDRIVSGG